jgi:hypothetical protein
MPVQSEARYLDDVLKFEEEDMRSREAITVLSGEKLLCGQVIGKVGKVLGSSSYSGTGNGTIGTISLGPQAKLGNYKAICTLVIANSGRFQVIDPDGIGLADALAGTAFTSPQINFTISDGSTDFALGDTFTIPVTVGSLKAKKISFTAVDGTQDAAGVIGDDYDASAADLKGFAIVREAVVSEQGLRWPVAFTSGGTFEVKAGHVITGATSTKTAKVVRVDLASGTWAGGDAAGTFIVEALSGDFQAENVDVGTNTNVATVAATASAAALAQLAAKYILTRKEV